jgi:NAD(P)-dependent dehydrogenase (short-subunit alcohol dehydrogenase family)
MADYGIAGKVAVVTGGSRGIGRGCALALAQEGVKVCLTARQPEQLIEAANDIRAQTGVEVFTVPADMSQREDVDGMIRTAADHFGRIDILVNNAASFPYGGTLDLQDEDWIGHFEVKTFGYLRTMRAVAPIMQANHWGRIVNIAGIAARTGGASAGATNAAIVNLTRSFGDALAKDGITANVVHPGAVVDSDREASREAPAGIPPIGRRVMVKDCAAAVAFFASMQAEAITGQTISVDGGQTRIVTL